MALFNNGYPASYPQTFIPQYQPPVQQQQQNNGIIWVQGEAGAKSYLVAPNNTVQLWDSESQTIYLKSADASGMPSMKILDYKIREGSATAPEAETYATKSDLDALQKRIAALQAELDEMSTRRRARLTREADDNE